MDETSWRWASEYGRDRLLKEAIENQNQATQSLNRSMARQAKEFQNDLKAVRGNVEARLNALTNAFLSYVRMEDVEKQLQAFAGHPEARSHALRSIQRLAAGQLPESLPDLPRYWLVPAVTALHPDGRLDESLAEQARQRNPEAAGIFLTIAQGAFGRGTAVVHDLPSLLRPDGEGRWSRWQVLVWQAVVLGAFGPDALEVVGDVVAGVLATEQDWDGWAQRTMKHHDDRKQPSTQQFATLRWVLDRFEEATGQALVVEGVSPQSTGPDFVAADSPVETPVPDDPAPEEEPTIDPQEAATTMLLEALTLRVVGSGEEEDELLLEASRAREEFMQLLKQTPSPDSPLATTPALRTVQEMVTAPGVPPASRTWLWRRLLPHFAPLAEQCGEGLASPPPAPEVTIAHVKDLVVGPDGVQQPSRLRAIRSNIEAQAPAGFLTMGIPVSVAGAVLLVLAVFLLTQNPTWGFLLLLVALAGLVLGTQLVSRTQTAREQVEAQLKSLDHKVERATKEALAQQERTQADRETRQELVTRFQAAQSALRRW
ncbi:hypothetical protein EII34_15285 [Arachnia propionica]|uniref:Uncharacterized protein n=1 Tax=Arachnia propionica TaxID=1750 RepID=A0A3P1T1I8_9ACTN|nr:hypothetical protein [Arachnia propionica]RRD03135.1 hypothetical protein EII34_15285 [Arachnia propionica]